jgi:hypothetical protein
METSVLLTADVDLWRAYAKCSTKDHLAALVIKSQIERVVQADGTLILIDKRLYLTPVSEAIEKLAQHMRGKVEPEVIEFGKVDHEVQSAMEVLLRSGPWASGFSEHVLKTKGLKIVVQPWMKMTAKRGDREITGSFGISPIMDHEGPKNMSFVRQPPGSAYNTERIYKEGEFNPDQVLVGFGPAMAKDRTVRTRLATKAFTLLEQRVASEEEARTKKRIGMSTCGLDQSWDGVSPIEFSQLSPKLQSSLGSGFSSVATNFGFSSVASARAWLSGATITRSQPNMMIWVMLPHVTTGFGLNTVGD